MKRPGGGVFFYPAEGEKTVEMGQILSFVPLWALFVLGGLFFELKSAISGSKLESNFFA
jgi:hypothetical protein